MIMADVLKIFLLIVGTLIVFIAYWLAAEALFPDWVNRAHRNYDRPFRLTGLGLVLVIPLLLVGMLVLRNQSNPLFKLAGFSLITFPVVVGLLGSAGLAQRIGQGLASPLDAAQPWRRVLRGGIVLAFTFLFPFIGWFLVLPWTLISGFGAAVKSLRHNVQSAPEAPLPAPRESAG